MQVKHTLKCNRVKGISFHPTRSWVLIGTYKAELMIVDYKLGSIIDTYQIFKSDGTISTDCIRCVDFHPTQPLFVCGGNDKNIYVFNYKTKKRTIKFEGHEDYVRTTFFHNSVKKYFIQYSFILSASDDNTIRMWNFQNKKQMLLLTGHKHYVMCAKFHKEKNLILSASLDHSVRLWDFSKLIEKMNSGSNNGYFNPMDVELVASVEAHENGLNWVSFHPVYDIFYTSADDRRVKVWKYDKDSVSEKETYFGHQDNVCCVDVNPKTVRKTFPFFF